MKHLSKDIRLTDELERELMMQAIDEQFRFKPGVALKNLWGKLTSLYASAKTSRHGHHTVKVG